LPNDDKNNGELNMTIIANKKELKMHIMEKIMAFLRKENIMCPVMAFSN